MRQVCFLFGCCLLAVNAAVNSVLGIGKLELVNQLLLHRGNAAGILTFENAHHTLRHGQSSAFRNLAVPDDALEGRHGPVVSRGNHIVVAHQQDVPAGILAGNLVQPAVVGENLPLCLLVQQGEVLLHNLTELGEFRVVIAVLHGHGCALEHPGEGVGVRSQFVFCERGMLPFQHPGLPGHPRGVQQQNGGSYQ